MQHYGLTKAVALGARHPRYAMTTCAMVTTMSKCLVARRPLLGRRLNRSLPACRARTTRVAKLASANWQHSRHSRPGPGLPWNSCPTLATVTETSRCPIPSTGHPVKFVDRTSPPPRIVIILVLAQFFIDMYFPHPFL